MGHTQASISFLLLNKNISDARGITWKMQVDIGVVRRQLAKIAVITYEIITALSITCSNDVLNSWK